VNDKERHVLELINTKKAASTAEICEALGYSESTARRILTRLANADRIQRYHGGGYSIELRKLTVGIQARFEQQIHEKDRIARIAVAQFENGSTVVLLGGTTVYSMCKYMRGMRITVITNSIIVFDELRNEPKIQLLLLGGQYNREEMETRGVFTHNNLKMLRANCLFMGTCKFHPQVGFMTTDINSVELYQLCLKASTKTFVLADSSKFGEGASIVIATCDMVDCLITDEQLPEKIRWEFNAAGVETICV
jgi:DeoR/GlpR family transcriptional regulator of sugar metabolism